MILLNLTIPPLLVIFLGPATLSNISMPAPNASAVAAFGQSGAPLPAWAYGGRLYVLQDGGPAVVEYVPAYSNSSGVLELSLNLPEPAIVVVPPGMMPKDVPAYRLIAVNSSGTYIEVGPGQVELSYYPIALSIPSTATAATAASTTTAPLPAAPVPATALIIAAVVVIVVAVAAALLLRKR
ncbi:MAG: IclR family transcriptional regulator [Thermoproteus sp. AZ2]|jgi:hypothetical protein|uniref:IclR family transcriptional regulator n=1 Tax=Thermoproteus sp. AZ2 TaxID=1609232 RepID=A0ACC6V2J1_9CREN